MRKSFSSTCFRFITVAAFLLAVAGIATPARADWNVGDPYKMHYPQLPDPFGWDVNFTQPKVVADDWLCTETGPVSDVHLWFSSHQDLLFNIFNVHLSIHADIPAGTGGLPYSRPGALLWAADFSPTQFSVRPWGTGDQGWYDPPSVVIPGDHLRIWQLNIQSILSPFTQDKGRIYWLDVSVATDGLLGWKTSVEHFNDDAVWSYLPGGNWEELRDPFTQQSLDMAFVITPEPTTLALVGMSLVGLLVFIRRQRT